MQPSKRVLVRWTDDHDKELLVWIVFCCAEAGTKIPFDKVAHYLGPNFSEGAIIQHLAKLRNKMDEAGLHVPPTAKRGAVSKPSTRIYSQPSRRAPARHSTSARIDDFYSLSNGQASPRRTRRQIKRNKIKNESDGEEFDLENDPDGDYVSRFGRKYAIAAATDAPTGWDADGIVESLSNPVQYDASLFEPRNHPAQQLPVLNNSGLTNYPSNIVYDHAGGNARYVNSEDEECETHNNIGHGHHKRALNSSAASKYKIHPDANTEYGFEPSFGGFNFSNNSATSCMAPPSYGIFNAVPLPVHISPYTMPAAEAVSRVQSFASASSGNSQWPTISPTTPTDSISRTISRNSTTDQTMSTEFGSSLHATSNPPTNQSALPELPTLPSGDWFDLEFDAITNSHLYDNSGDII